MLVGYCVGLCLFQELGLLCLALICCFLGILFVVLRLLGCDFVFVYFVFCVAYLFDLLLVGLI